VHFRWCAATAADPRPAGATSMPKRRASAQRFCRSLVRPLRLMPQLSNNASCTMGPAKEAHTARIQCGVPSAVTAASTAARQPSRVPATAEAGRQALAASSIRQPLQAPMICPVGDTKAGAESSGSQCQPGRDTMMISSGGSAALSAWTTVASPSPSMRSPAAKSCALMSEAPIRGRVARSNSMDRERPSMPLTVTRSP
jgi:hypothetical protein